MIGPIATALTFGRNFIGPCLWVLLAGFIAGGSSGGWLAWKLQDGRAARAETALERLQHEQTQAIADAAAKQVTITQDVLGGLYEQRQQIAGIASDIDRLRAGVRLCSSVSTMRPAEPAARTDEGAEGGQPRPAADVLSDLAAEFARAADDNAAQVRALQQWAEQTAR